MEVDMGYTLVGLEDKILQMYPEIIEQQLNPSFSYDEEKDVWWMKLKKGGSEAVICIDKEDADACMEKTYCERLEKEVAKALQQLKGGS
jgi:hypothetical protein